MTPEDRRRILGDEVIEHIYAVVDAAPAPTPDVVEALRRIFTQPLGAAPAVPAPAAEAA